MVLGSKFLNFIIKGAALLKQPHYNRLSRVLQQRKLQRYQRLMTALTLCNLLCLLCWLPCATRSQFVAVLGESLARPFFFVYSHAVVFVRTLRSELWEQENLAKVLVYSRTLGKMLLYSFGLSQGQVQSTTLSSCFSSLYPYALSILAFFYNYTDGLKFTRFTLLLVLWSVYAHGSLLVLSHIHIDEVTLMLVGSLLTLLLLATNRSSLLKQSLSNESPSGSFHRLCADECFSDDESISMLSQQLNCSAQSLGSSRSTTHTLRPKKSPQNGLSRPPSVLSLDSLHLSSQQGRSVASKRAFSPFYSSPSLNVNGHQASTMYPAPALSTVSRPLGFANYPFSVSSGTLHRQQPRATPCSTTNSGSLLLPSRFAGGHLNQPMQRNGDVSAWLANTSANQMPEMGFAKEGKLSRTSSQSSGFESQMGHQAAPPPPPTAPSLNWGPNSSMVGDYGWATQSPHYEETHQAALRSSHIKPGDLLKKWIDRTSNLTESDRHLVL